MLLPFGDQDEDGGLREGHGHDDDKSVLAKKTHDSMELQKLGKTLGRIEVLWKLVVAHQMWWQLSGHETGRNVERTYGKAHLYSQMSDDEHDHNNNLLDVSQSIPWNVDKGNQSIRYKVMRISSPDTNVEHVSERGVCELPLRGGNFSAWLYHFVEKYKTIFLLDDSLRCTKEIKF